MITTGSRVLIKPLGVRGIVVRKGRVAGIVVVQADSGGPPLPWNLDELAE